MFVSQEKSCQNMKKEKENEMAKMSNITVLKQKEQPTIFIRTRTSVDKLPQLIEESYCKMSAYLK